MRPSGDDAGHRAWSLELLAESEPGRRNRRSIDAVLVAVGAAIVGLAAVIAGSASAEDDAVGKALVTVFGWAQAVWRVALVAALVLAVGIVVDAMSRRRRDLARDLAIALLLLAGFAGVLGRVVDADWLPIAADPFAAWGFPELRLAIVVVVLTIAGPELVQPVRRLVTWLVPLAALGVVALGASSPAGALGGLALGLGAGALVRLTFGSAAGIPPVGRVRVALAALGVDLTDLRIAERQRVGAAEYFARDADGSDVKVRVLGRDAQDTQWLARRWRLLAYRDPPRSAPIGRLEQVEHEALATLMAAQAGVRVPEVVTAGLGPDGDALLVTRQPDAAPLEETAADRVGDETLADLWRQAALLHRAGISHGRFNASNVIAGENGAMLVDLSAATLGAPQSALDTDTAEMLVACAVLVGPERTLGKAVELGGADALARALPYLQPAALTPHLRELARKHEVALKKLRADVAEATGTEQPEIAPLRRIRPRDVAMTAALIFSAYLLISKLAETGFGTIADELRGATIAWVVVALLLVQFTFIPSGVSVRGGVVTPLPLLPCVVLQSAIKFVNLTVPSSAGRIGLNLRVLQGLGAPREEAIVGGAVDDASNKLIKASLLLLTLPLIRGNVDTGKFAVGGPNRRLLLSIGVGLAVGAVILLVAPRIRARVTAGVRRALSAFWTVMRTRRKRVEVFGGTLVAELFTALALGANTLAYGEALHMWQLIFVVTSASLISSAIPVPGGIGAAEAALSTGLIAMGIASPTAFAIAITQRLCTFYLPPIWGYLALRWLTRQGYV